MFKINDVVVFKNATKYGTHEFTITYILGNLLTLDGHINVPDHLVVLC